MKPTIAFRVNENTKFKLEELSKMREESQAKIIEWALDMAYFTEQICKHNKEERLQGQTNIKSEVL